MKVKWKTFKNEKLVVIDSRWHLRIRTAQSNLYLWTFDEYLWNGVVRKYGMKKTCKAAQKKVIKLWAKQKKEDPK